MTDRLDNALALKRKIEADLLRRLYSVRAEIKTLEDAANLGVSQERGESSKKPGRQKGAISHKWRAVLRDMYDSGHANTRNEIAKFVTDQGLTVSYSSLTVRLRDYIKDGYLEMRKDGFWVTDYAIDRFDFDKPINE